MVIAWHVDSLVCGLTVHHIIVVALVHGRGVLLPEVASQVVIGIDAIRLVAIGYAMVNVVRGTYVWTFRLIAAHAPAASLEAIAISGTLES